MIIQEATTEIYSGIELFEKTGLTAETFLTGQCTALFTKMFANDKIHQNGLFPPEVLEAQQRSCYLNETAKLDIAFDQKGLFAKNYTRRLSENSIFFAGQTSGDLEHFF